jgi:hypothetical protein
MTYSWSSRAGEASDGLGEGFAADMATIRSPSCGEDGYIDPYGPGLKAAGERERRPDCSGRRSITVASAYPLQGWFALR